MIDIDRLYFEWLLKRLESDVEDSALGLPKLCWIMYHMAFERRVGLDANRAENGLVLRQDFLSDWDELDISPSITNPFAVEDSCTWLEMLIRLAEDIDYLYEGGVRGRFIEMCRNMGFGLILLSEEEHTDHDVNLVDTVLDNINHSHIQPNGEGGLFPLKKPGHLDQRGVEIWAQAAAYFSEKSEGELWTSTN